MRLLMALAALALIATPASAQSQRALNQRADADYRAADAGLNRAYRNLSQTLSPSSRALLQQSERAWIGFRDSECRFQAAGVQGGSVYPMIYSACLADLTRQRTRQLQTLANCPEGDLSCPR
jgi:uncharacterized protein YecT (DUF1311 family)